MNRVHNFGAGPGALPLEVVETAQKELLDFQGTGMSIMEMSHRSKEYDAVHQEAMANVKELLGLGDNFKVLFVGGGASTQFAMVPMNLLGGDKSADYVVTGHWSEGAVKEAKLFGKVNIAATTKENDTYTRIPKQDELKLDPSAVYVHVTSNNTIYGTQWASFPETGNVPIVCDMSSDFLSRPIPAEKFGLIYAGAQKNMGPAGVTVVVVREDVLGQCRQDLPTMLKYTTHASKDSLYNTPPVFPIYVSNLVLRWIKAKGGLAGVQRENEAKGKAIYGAIDESGGFYRGPVAKDSRSLMNVVFRLPSEELEAKFIAEGKKQSFVGMKGHRSTGGIRVSTYNAVPLASVQAVVSFMKEFARTNG